MVRDIVRVVGMSIKQKREKDVPGDAEAMYHMTITW